MAEVSARFMTRVARRIPDPNFKKTHNLERHVFVVPVRGMPKDLPLDPNARRPKTSKRIYQTIAQSLVNEECAPGTFHLKNKGITIVADRVDQLGNDEYLVIMKHGIHGIVDGGHTYTLIMERQDDPALPEDQFVTVEVLVGVPLDWIADIAGGLNTSVQVQSMSLDNLSGAFTWIKEELKNEPYFTRIAWSENDPGEFDARDIVSLMTLFNVEAFPNNADEHPVYAYEKKSTALEEFEAHTESYMRIRPLLKDILQFHDIIRKEYRDIWNQAYGGAAGKLAFSETRKKGKYEFPFTGEQSDVRMVNGALYPILAAFRWYVIQDPITHKIKWRDGFNSVRKAWRAAAPSLLKATHDMSNALGRNPQSVGKNRPHWSNLHNIVAKKDLEARQAAAE